MLGDVAEDVLQPPFLQNLHMETHRNAAGWIEGRDGVGHSAFKCSGSRAQL
jgi:hypothetical protein